MRILLANNTLSLLAGSEMWTYTLAKALKEKGHDVTCFAGELGIISEKLEEDGIKCFKEINFNQGIKKFSVELEETINHEYDVIIANHNHIVEYLRNKFPKTPIISTIHGIIHEYEGQIAPEHPALNSGVNQFVSVSEEIQEKLKNDYNLESIVIRNPIDINRFNCKEVNEKPKQFLFSSNYHNLESEEVKIMREVVQHYGARLTAVGINFAQTFDIEKAIEDSDVVIGMGRSVLEGVAAGRLGIVHGRWGTGGIFNEKNIELIRKFNYSGRNSNGILWNKEEFIEAIDLLYTKENLEWCKNYMKREHGAGVIADKYLRIARELTGRDINKEEEKPLPKLKFQNEENRIA